MVTIDSVEFHLAQPAFGIAKTNSIMRSFPPGALILASTVTVGSLTLEQRFPNAGHEVVFQNSGSGFNASNMDVVLRVPCNTSEAVVTARVTLKKSPSSSALAKPPTISIEV
jgi:hypothetical protein